MFSATETEKIARQYVLLKSEVEQKTAQLRDLAKQLAGSATFPEGKNTAHMVSGGYDFTIQRKENVRWDQKKLATCRADFGDDLFFKLFGWKYEPNTKILNGFFETGDPSQIGMVLDARTVSPGAPQISFEAIEQAGEV